MIDAQAIGDILSIYAKHGWLLRRVLLSQTLDASLGDSVGTLFGDAVVTGGDLDAVWFSRPPRSGGVAWEIRHLSETPFALLENLDESSKDFESERTAVEARLLEAVRAKKPA